MITCVRCKQEKDESEFYLSKQNKSGYVGSCIKCVAERSAEYRAKNKEVIAAKKKAYHKAHPEKQAVRQKRYAIKNRDIKNAKSKERYCANIEQERERSKEYYKLKPEIRKAAIANWRANNPEREKTTARLWVERNRERVRAYGRANAKRNAAYRRFYQMTKMAMRAKATPHWACKETMKEIYELAQMREKATGIKWQVDHIIPLKGVTVCGLHVETNLRVIPAAANLAKRNYFDAENIPNTWRY